MIPARGQLFSPKNGICWERPVARVSFLHHAYHVAHNFSGIDKWVLTSETAS